MSCVLATTNESFASMALPLGLGAVAAYLLLPRPRPISRWLGASFAAAALLFAGWLLVRPLGANAETILFYVFSGLAVLSGGLLITQRNPVHAALSFALVVLSTCGLFLLQAAPFLMAATIIVYAGAIVVTFLFVIMLAQQAGISDADARSREPLLSVIAGFVLLGALLYVLHLSFEPRQGNTAAITVPQPLPRKPERFSDFSGPRPNHPLEQLARDEQGLPPMPAENVAALGRALFTDYLIPVELGGTLLLVATIGAIVIAGRRAEGLQ